MLKMRQIRKEFVVVNLILISIILLIPFSLVFAESGKWLEFKLLWYSVFTPKDYYESLVSEELDISKKGLIKRFTFKHKYVGNHDAGIYLAKFGNGNIFFESFSKRYRLNLKMEINFYVDGKLTLSKLVEHDYSPFMGQKERSGLMFMFYKVPTDLPIDTQIECEVKIVEPDEHLYNTYGPVKFYVRKTSDK